MTHTSLDISFDITRITDTDPNQESLKPKRNAVFDKLELILWETSPGKLTL